MLMEIDASEASAVSS